MILNEFLNRLEESNIFMFQGLVTKTRKLKNQTQCANYKINGNNSWSEKC